MNITFSFLKKFKQYFWFQKRKSSNNISLTLAKEMNHNSNSTFSLELANHVIKAELNNGTNSGISPLSLQVMLSLIAAGSTGRTLEQLLSHLGSNNVHELNLLSSKLVELVSKRGNDTNHVGGLLVSFVNGAWVDQSVGLNIVFQKVSEEFFKAHVKEVDFVNKVCVSVKFSQFKIRYYSSYLCPNYNVML